uniref:Stathmin n=1 Tax=Takifugu rubripes TaxID=31033 RepID=A0A674MGL6_TAKRU
MSVKVGDPSLKELDRRSSGSAFQLILSPSNAKEAKAKVLLSPERKEISLEEQKKKMAAAEERRKSREFEMLKHFAEVREHEKEVLQKVVEERNTFSKTTQENLAQKMEAYKENRGAQMAALSEKFKARDKKLEEVKKKLSQ